MLVIDDDQGISGQSVENRPGFQRLLAEVSLGHVGIVFGREMSRLARSCNGLAPVARAVRLFQVLLADADGVYDPTDVNDRLLLGLKGTMSEAELHVLRSAAAPGQVEQGPPGRAVHLRADRLRPRRPTAASPWTPTSRSGPSSRWCSTSSPNSARCRRPTPTSWPTTSASGCGSYKGPDKGRLVWQRPRRSTLYEMLRHPFYAGAYVYGRCPFDPTRGPRAERSRAAGRPRRRSGCACSRTGCRRTSPGSSTRRTGDGCAENDRGRGAARAAGGRGPTLLNGIVTCGRCGRPMVARNARPTAAPAVRLRRGEAGVRRAALPERVRGGDRPADRGAGAAGGRAGGAGVEPAGGRAGRAGSRAAARALEADAGAGRVRGRAVRGGSTTRSTRRTGWWPGQLERQWEQKLTEKQRLEEDYARFRPSNRGT